MSIFANPDEVFLSQYVLPGSSEWPAEEREAALKSIDRAVKHQIQQIEHDRAHGTERAEAIFCDHSQWREAEAKVEKLRGQRDQWMWLYHQLRDAIRRHRNRVVPSSSDREQRDADEVLWALIGTDYVGDDPPPEHEQLLEVVQNKKALEDEVEKLHKIIDELVWDGCVYDDGECWWCGGALEPVSCNREDHVGCMGYSDQGDHAEDCPYVAAREVSAWRTG